MGVFAKFERTMIVERVKSGLSRARVQGKRGSKTADCPRLGE
jgi:DNA invertase Pin-like site-specific DNA recombinase